MKRKLIINCNFEVFIYLCAIRWNKQLAQIFGLIAIVSVLFCGLLANATDYEWQGGDGYWTNSANWLPVGIPGSGDFATITKGNVIISKVISISQIEVDSNSSLTVATNGVLNLNCSDISLYINGPFTNKGVVNWMDGDIKVVKDSFGNCGCIQNMECATWNIQCNCGIWVASGSEKFNNSGTVTKTDGSGITTFDILWNNSGLVQSQSGTICFNRNSTLNGGNYLTKGGKISYGVNATVTVTGAITNLVACDVFVVGLSNITQTAYLTNCEISTSETVIGNVYLIHGTIDSNSSLTVATNGVLNLNCSDISLYINGPFTNKGVVNWMDGDIKVVKDSFGNCGCIQNMECATWNIQCNCGIWVALTCSPKDGHGKSRVLLVKEKRESRTNEKEPIQRRTNHQRVA